MSYILNYSYFLLAIGSITATDPTELPYLYELRADRSAENYCPFTATEHLQKPLIWYTNRSAYLI